VEYVGRNRGGKTAERKNIRREAVETGVRKTVREKSFFAGVVSGGSEMVQWKKEIRELKIESGADSRLLFFSLCRRGESSRLN